MRPMKPKLVGCLLIEDSLKVVIEVRSGETDSL